MTRTSRQNSMPKAQLHVVRQVPKKSDTISPPLRPNILQQEPDSNDGDMKQFPLSQILETCRPALARGHESRWVEMEGWHLGPRDCNLCSWIHGIMFRCRTDSTLIYPQPPKWNEAGEGRKGGSCPISVLISRNRLPALTSKKRG